MHIQRVTLFLFILFGLCVLSCDSMKSGDSDKKEQVTDWGNANAGLSCRLKLTGTKFSLAGTVPVTLEIKNISGSEVSFHLNRLNKSFRVFDSRGEESPFRGNSPRRSRQKIVLGPGEIHTVNHSLRPESYLLSAKEYKVHFDEKESAEGDCVAVTLKSPALRFAMIAR
jgi:hypothetical protein